MILMIEIRDNSGEAIINEIIVIFKNWDACFIKNVFLIVLKFIILNMKASDGSQHG